MSQQDDKRDTRSDYTTTDRVEGAGPLGDGTDKDEKVVGGGMGAVGGAAIGTVLGGPVGTVAGAAVGGLAGGVAGGVAGDQAEDAAEGDSDDRGNTLPR